MFPSLQYTRQDELRSTIFDYFDNNLVMQRAVFGYLTYHERLFEISQCFHGHSRQNNGFMKVKSVLFDIASVLFYFFYQYFIQIKGYLLIK